MPRRLLPPGQLTNFTGNVILDYSANIDDVLSLSLGSVEFDTANKIGGDGSLKIICDAGNSQNTAEVNNLSLDFSSVNDNEYIGVWLYHDRDTGIGEDYTDHLEIYLAKSPTAPTDYYTLNENLWKTSVARIKGWSFFGAPKSEWVFNGSPDWSDIQSVHFRLKNGDTAATSINIDSLITAPKITALISLSFDDSGPSVFDEAFRILEPYGIKASSYATKDRISDFGGGGMSLAEHHTLHDAGWMIGNHYLTHDSAVAVTIEQARINIEDMAEWLESEGFEGRYVAYVGGGTNIEVTAMCRDDLSIKWARLAGTSYAGQWLHHHAGGVDAFDIYHYPSYELGWTISLATAKGWVDDCVANKKYIDIYGHDLVATAGTDNEWDIADYEALALHIKTYIDRGLLTVVNPDDLV